MSTPNTRNRNNQMIVLAAVAIVLAAMALLGTTNSADAQKASKARCGGKVVTLAGTPGPDVLRGTPRADVIHGFGGDDIIMGLAGNDIICGGGGQDEITAGAGNDRVIAGDGDDKLIGNRGNDRLEAGKGDDTLNGGPGRDTCLGGFGQDTGSSCEVKRAILKKTLVTQRRGSLRPGGAMTWKFRAEKGEQLYVNFDEDTSDYYDGSWDISRGDTKLASSSRLGDAGDTVEVERTGWYTVKVEADDDSSATFGMQVVRAPRLLRPYKMGELHRDRIGIPGEKHALRFSGKAGDRIYIDWDEIDSIYEGSWELYPVQGFDRSEVASSSRLSDGDDAIVLPRSGQFDLVVDGSGDKVLSYSVVVRKVTRKVQTARIGQTISGQIAVPGETDVIRINGKAGQTLTIDWSEATPRYDGSWSLIEVGGFDNEVARGSSFGDLTEDGVVLPANGRYDVVVDGKGDNVFDWEVTLSN